MKVFLVGYMGVGKTTIGKRLASSLGSPFFDLDKRISEMSHKSINTLFEELGETGFRALEQSVLAVLVESETDFVLATGGGAPTYKDTMKMLVATGLVIWLKMPEAQLMSRLEQGKSERPLLKDIPSEELPTYISNHYRPRVAFYQKAQLHVDAADFGAAELEDLIKRIAFYSK